MRLLVEMLLSAAMLVLGRPAQAVELEQIFADPPRDARPGVMWYWINGHVSKAGITADLEAMNKVGLRFAMISHIGGFISPGPVAYGSPAWLDAIAHAAREAKRLNIELGMHNSEGWSSSGGPWVTVEDSMQLLVWSSRRARVGSDGAIDATLPQPLTRLGHYREVAVLALPVPPTQRLSLEELAPHVTDANGKRVESAAVLWDGDVKSTLAVPKAGPADNAVLNLDMGRPVVFSRLTLSPTGQFLFHCKVLASGDGQTFEELGVVRVEGNSEHGFEWRWGLDLRPNAPVRYYRLEFTKPAVLAEVEMTGRDPDAGPEAPIGPEQVVNLTSNFTAADGRLRWKPPHGSKTDMWLLLRIGHTARGEKNHPAQVGRGLEVDKISRDAVRRHLEAAIDPVLGAVGGLAGDSFVYGGFIDSYEIGRQNWTPRFPEEFARRRGYELGPWLAALAEVHVGGPDLAGRAVFDWQRTLGDLWNETYYGFFAQWLHERRLKFATETYGDAYWDSFRCAGFNDMPMGEFWYMTEFMPPNAFPNRGPSTGHFASSAANVYGRPIVAAEAFTSEVKFDFHPWGAKRLGDLAFTSGVNRMLMHNYAHQPDVDPANKPGLVWPNGIHFTRNLTWWEPGRVWLDYLARCQALLQRGFIVRDVLAYGGVGPVRFDADFQVIKAVPRGYDYDGLDTETLLERLSVREDGRLVLPHGPSYALLTLPKRTTMTPPVLRRLRDLVSQGARVYGPPPDRVPGLQYYPDGEAEIRGIAKELWGPIDGKTVTRNAFGKGMVYWAGRADAAAINAVLADMRLAPDFDVKDPGGDFLPFIHRCDGDRDIYFIPNLTGAVRSLRCTFRVNGKLPRLFRPESGAIEPCGWHTEADGRTTIPLKLGMDQSVFVVFGPEPLPSPSQPPPRVEELHELMPIEGPWDVAFDPRWVSPPLDGPADGRMKFERLVDWTARPEPGLRHYSGTATYSCTFTVQQRHEGKVVLDLGQLREMAEVLVNGREAGISWMPPYRLDVTTLLQVGVNRLEVRVTNTWANRLIGDHEAPPERRRARITMPLYKRGDPLPASGLVGPVRLLVAAGPAAAATPTAQQKTGVEATTPVFSPAPQKVVSAEGASVVFHTEPQLDLGSETEASRADGPDAKVPYAPAVVAGEGPDETNHTLVRVFNEFQTRTAQFLAYPPTVRGGVQVCGARVGDETLIATAPIADTAIRHVRVFDRSGLLRRAIAVERLLPPLVIATGDYLPGTPGEELAVAARTQVGESLVVRCYGLADGKQLAEVSLPRPTPDDAAIEKDTLSLSTRRRTPAAGDLLQAYADGGRLLQVIDMPATAFAQRRLGTLPAGSTVHASAFTGEVAVATLPDDSLSQVSAIDASGSGRTVDVGRRENMFWFASRHTDRDTFVDPESSVQLGQHAHAGVVNGNPTRNMATTAEIERVGFDDWQTPYLDHGTVVDIRKRALPTNWQTMYLASQFQSAPWMAEADAETGRPAMLMLDADDKPIGPSVLTYSYNVPALDRLFYFGMRRMHLDLAVDVRLRPELFIGLSPAHEMATRQGGDYNPSNIRAFRDQLLQRFGSLEAVNRRYSTTFASTSLDHFDAPRNRGRGPWDQNGSDYQRAWSLFHAHTIDRLLHKGYRTALRAGIPPEALKAHQIPGAYLSPGAFTGHFFENNTSPIDVVLTSGVGFGCTRYGKIYDKPADWLQGAFSSGQTLVTAGEYGVFDRITPQQAKEQARWMFDNGLTFFFYTHPEGMYGWRETQDALADLHARRVPRPGTTGGVGAVIPIAQPDWRERIEEIGGTRRFVTEPTGGRRPLHLLSVGTGPRRNGLIKSVDAKGQWDGTVYLRPFHAHVQVASLMELGTSGPAPVPLRGAGGFALFGLNHGDQVELRFRARARGKAPASVGVRCLQDLAVKSMGAKQDQTLWADDPARVPAFGGYEIAGSATTFTLGPEWREYRYVLANELPLESAQLAVRIDGDVEVLDWVATSQRLQAARPAFGTPLGTAHRGGVTFDVLDREQLAPAAENVPAEWTREGLTAKRSWAKALAERSPIGPPAAVGQRVPAQYWLPTDRQALLEAAANASTFPAINAAVARFTSARRTGLCFPNVIGEKHAFTVNAGTAQWIAGPGPHPGGAIRLDELGGRLSIADLPLPDNFTIELHMRLPETIWNSAGILTVGDGAAVLAGYWLDTRNLSWGNRGGKGIEIFGDSPRSRRDGPGFDPTKWYRISLVKEGRLINAYSEGTLVAEGEAPETLQRVAPIVLGDRVMELDELSIWAGSRAATNLGKPVTTDEPGLIGRWTFDEVRAAEKR